jgi:hypothetical protein
MNYNRIIKFAIIGFVIIITIGVLGILVWAETGTYPAGTVALSALESTDNVIVAQDNWIVFTPVDLVETGLIFYPGGLVEPTAYAPVLQKIAEKGVVVIIIPMPLNLAILNTGAANLVMDAYPNISTWIIAGHSLGGASAAIFVENNPERIDALALWSVPVLSIFGTTNKTPNTENFDDKKYLLPADTLFMAIEGANHAQFGDYGPQKGDVVASISLSQQHERVAEMMLDFINP